MFRSVKRKRRVSPRSPLRRSQNSRSLRFEPLESRVVLSGVVNVQIFPAVAPGTMNFVGDGSNNEIEVRQSGTLDARALRFDLTAYSKGGTAVLVDYSENPTSGFTGPADVNDILTLESKAQKWCLSDTGTQVIGAKPPAKATLITVSWAPGPQRDSLDRYSRLSGTEALQ